MDFQRAVFTPNAGVGKPIEGAKSFETMSDLMTNRPEGTEGVSVSLEFRKMPIGEAVNILGQQVFELTASMMNLRQHMEQLLQTLAAATQAAEDPNSSEQLFAAAHEIADLPAEDVDLGDLPADEPTEEQRAFWEQAGRPGDVDPMIVSG